MNCQEIQEKLLAHRVGELDDAAAAALHQHLETCAACRAAAEETERVLDLMRSAFAAGPVAPAQLDKRHRKRVLRANFSWPAYGPLLLKLAAVLVAVLGVGALFAMFSDTTRAKLSGAVSEMASTDTKMERTLNNGKQIFTSAFGRTLDGVVAPSQPAAAAAPEPFSTLARAERGEERKTAASAPADTLKGFGGERDWGDRGGLEKNLEYAKQPAVPPPAATMPAAKQAAGASTLSFGGGTVVLGGSGAVIVHGTVSGAGALNKSGAGTLTLDNANTYRGGTFVNGGTLALDTVAATDGRVAGSSGAAADRPAKLDQHPAYRLGGGGGTLQFADELSPAAGSGGAGGGGGANVMDLNGTTLNWKGAVANADDATVVNHTMVIEPEGRRGGVAQSAQSASGVNSYGVASAPNYAGWAEAGGQPQQGQQDSIADNKPGYVALRTALPKPMLAGTPYTLPNVVVAQKDAYQLNERLNEVSTAPAAGLKADAGDQLFYARTDATKKSEDHRKNVDELQRGPGAVAGTALNLTAVQPDSGRDGAQQMGTVVTSGGVLNFNGGTVVTLGNGTAAVSGEEAASKAKEADTGLRQEQLAADKSGAENLHRLQPLEGVTALPVGAAQPAAGPEVRGLTVDNWAMAEAAAPAAPANGPAAWGFAGKDQELKLAEKIKSSQITKGLTRGYGGRMGRADLPADTDAETASESKNSLVALGDVRTASGQDGDNGAQPEAGRALKRERALEEMEKTRQPSVLATDADEKAKPETPAEPMPTSAAPVVKLADKERLATEERLKKIIIPQIEFRQADIRDVIKSLSQTITKEDTAGDGVKVELDAAVKNCPLTISLRRVCARDAFKYVAALAGIDCQFTDKGVVFVAQDYDASHYLERRYPLSPELAKAMGGANIQKNFEEVAGVRFPAGASARYDEQRRELIVVHTPGRLETIEGLLAPLDWGKPTEPPTKPVFRAAGANPWMAVEEQTFSTFSISVDSASFTLARRYLNGGQRPPPESVRTEEFVNFFEYAYAPPGRDLFSVHAQAARTPFCPPGVQLLKLGIKGRQMGRENRGANLTFLLDTSGSMNAPDRLDLARAALKLLVAKLGSADRVALVTFSSRARLVLDFTPATDRQRILAALDGIQAAGFTHLEAGLKLAYETAARGFVSGASNRIILMSDGVANVGADATAELLAQVEQYRKQGIFCSVFGLGTGTYDDTMLQALASKGNGTYLFMDSLEEARRVFVDELAATLNKIAADVKIQVEFNPRRVKQYRQLGYEQRQLKTEDFRNDAVAAGEVGSGQSVTALYQVELQGDANEPIGTVRVRGRNLETGRVEELERAITAADFAPSFEQADARFRLAAAAAEFAEILRGSPYAAGAGCADVAKVLRPVALELSLDQKVQELLRLVNAAGGAPQAAE